MPHQGATAFSYPASLGSRCEGRPKGERTRAQIQIAACHVLDREGPQELKVAAICRSAGVSNGTFYIYFAHRNQLLDELVTEFVHFLLDVLRAAGSDGSGDPVRAATRAYYELFRQNCGLMRCLIHYLDSFPEARAAFHRLNRDWLETVVSAVQSRLQRHGRTDTLSREELLRRAYALGGMVDQYLSSLLLSRDPAVAAISRDTEAVLDTLTLIWKRGMAA